LGASLKRLGHRPLNAQINVTPFVDVMLVLLVIFMVTAPLMYQGMDVNLPETTTQALRLRDDGTAERQLWADSDKRSSCAGWQLMAHPARRRPAAERRKSGVVFP
jgi:hypothetical protein